MSARGADVGIVGSGIVGLACAFHLRRRGLSCVMIDARGPGLETSFGNAGSISVGNVMPQSTPGIAGKALRMLLDPQAPLKLDLPRLPSYAGWLWQFVRHGGRKRILAIIDALHAINAASRAPWLDMARDIGAQDLLGETGYLHVYSEPRSFENGAWERELMRERGVRFDVLDDRQLRDLEPGIGTQFRTGVFQRDALALLDPAAFCHRLHETLVARGAQTLTTRVQQLVPDAQGVTLRTDSGDVRVGRVVVAAGAWSDALLRPLNVTLPIVPARGYHLMYAPQENVVHRPTLWSERYMVLSPMRTGIRMTSIKELTTLDSPANFTWIHRRDADARRLYPALSGAPVSEWAGYRPCTPDSLPVIDRVAERVWVAVGHGHLGVTQAAVTGRVIDQLIAGEGTEIEVAVYSAGRFSR
jgi:D-amino-acid dehydrogenase